MFNIDAPGGCGKTFLCNIILAYVRSLSSIAIACALSGIAATLMTMGTTFHRRFGAPINANEDHQKTSHVPSTDYFHGTNLGDDDTYSVHTVYKNEIKNFIDELC